MQTTKEIKTTALIITKCMKGAGNKELEKGYSEFSFEGKHLGQNVKKVLIEPSKFEKFIEGEQYVIWIRVSSLMAGVLRACAVKSKKLL